MRLLFAVLFLLNIAYHDTCTPLYYGAPGNVYDHLGRMDQIERMGQMGQMLTRNGNVSQTLPIKKNGKIWEFSKTVGEGSPKSLLHFTFYRRNCHKMVIKGKLGEDSHMGGGRGVGEIPIFPLFYWECLLVATEIAFAM